MLLGAFYALMFNWAHLEDYPLRRQCAAAARFLTARPAPQRTRRVAMSSASRDVTLPIPNGWFAVAFSRELVDGEVKRVRYFDEELVLFRTRSGRAAVLDAYCPHLGAHLAEGGRVIGESMRCPFHGWQYDGDGRLRRDPLLRAHPADGARRAPGRCWSATA